MRRISDKNIFFSVNFIKKLFVHLFSWSQQSMEDDNQMVSFKYIMHTSYSNLKIYPLDTAYMSTFGYRAMHAIGQYARLTCNQGVIILQDLDSLLCTKDRMLSRYYPVSSGLQHFQSYASNDKNKISICKYFIVLQISGREGVQIV